MCLWKIIFVPVREVKHFEMMELDSSDWFRRQNSYTSMSNGQMTEKVHRLGYQRLSSLIMPVFMLITFYFSFIIQSLIQKDNAYASIHYPIIRFAITATHNDLSISPRVKRTIGPSYTYISFIFPVQKNYLSIEQLTCFFQIFELVRNLDQTFRPISLRSIDKPFKMFPILS